MDKTDAWMAMTAGQSLTASLVSEAMRQGTLPATCTPRCTDALQNKEEEDKKGGGLGVRGTV